MPIIPNTMAIAPAIPSITSVNEVRATDLSYTSCIVRTDASGKLEFTDHTAWRTSLRKAWVPARSLRIANVMDYADHLVPRRARKFAQSLADGRGCRAPHLARQIPRDHYHGAPTIHF